MKKTLLTLAMEDAGCAALAQDDIGTNSQIDLNIIGELYADDPDHITKFAVECDRYYETLEYSLAILGDMNHLRDELAQVDPNTGINDASTAVLCKAVEEFGRQLGYVPSQVGTKIAKESLGVSSTPQRNLKLAKEGLGDFIAKIFTAILDMIKKIGEWVANGFKKIFGGGGGGGGGGGSSDSRNEKLGEMLDEAQENLKASNYRPLRDPEVDELLRKHADNVDAIHKAAVEKLKEHADDLMKHANRNNYDKTRTVEVRAKELAEKWIKARDQLRVNNFKLLWFNGNETSIKMPVYISNELRRVGEAFVKPYEDICGQGLAKAIQGHSELVENSLTSGGRNIADVIKGSDALAREFVQRMMPQNIIASKKEGEDRHEIFTSQTFLGNRVLVITLPEEAEGKSNPSASTRYYSANITVPEEYRKDHSSDISFPLLEYDDAKKMIEAIRKLSAEIDKRVPHATLEVLKRIQDECKEMRDVLEKVKNPQERAHIEKLATYALHYAAVTQKLMYQYVLQSKAYQVQVVREIHRYLAITINVGQYEAAVMIMAEGVVAEKDKK